MTYFGGLACELDPPLRVGGREILIQLKGLSVVLEFEVVHHDAGRCTSDTVGYPGMNVVVTARHDCIVERGSV